MEIFGRATPDPDATAFAGGPPESPGRGAFGRAGGETLKIVQHAAPPEIETCLVSKFAETAWPTLSVNSSRESFTANWKVRPVADSCAVTTAPRVSMLVISQRDSAAAPAPDPASSRAPSARSAAESAAGGAPVRARLAIDWSPSLRLAGRLGFLPGGDELQDRLALHAVVLRQVEADAIDELHAGVGNLHDVLVDQLGREAGLLNLRLQLIDLLDALLREPLRSEERRVGKES